MQDIEPSQSPCGECTGCCKSLGVGDLPSPKPRYEAWGEVGEYLLQIASSSMPVIISDLRHRYLLTTAMSLGRLFLPGVQLFGIWAVMSSRRRQRDGGAGVYAPGVRAGRRGAL
jgi:hypothetical protein